MKLCDRFAERGYHTSVATTFGVDFDAYESIVLARLRGAGCRNNLLVADARMITLALSDVAALPTYAGSRYTVRGSGAANGGVFHPKLFLQVGRDRGRLMLGSANLTAAGLAGNLEIVATLACGETDSGERQLVARAWEYLAGLLDPDQATQADWMLARAGWLESAVPTSGPVELADGTLAALLLSDGWEAIGRRFAELVDEPVDRVIAISPYWDGSLAALVDLERRLRPARIDVLLDPATRAFPAEVAARRLPELQLFGRGGFHAGRYIHAKVFVAMSEQADHVLIGSANCTSAALGAGDGPGRNAEACVYRRVPPGTALQALGLAAALSDGQRINVLDMPSASEREEIPLADLASRSPGSFRSRADLLTWRPAAGIRNPEGYTVTLVDGAGADLPDVPEYLRTDADEVKHRTVGMARSAAFARVRSPDGAASGLAIITQVDALAEEVRDVRSRRDQALLEQFDLGGDTEVTVDLLRIIDELEEIGRERPSLGQPIARPRSEGRVAAGPAPTYRHLPYEEFMAHRRPPGTDKQLSASFIGSDLSLVRGLLNRIVGVDAAGVVEEADAENPDLVKAAFDLGDEAAQDDGAYDSAIRDDEPSLMEEPDVRTRHATRVATVKQIVDAVARFSAGVGVRKASGELSPMDLLRLRALLTIVCCAALPCSSTSGETQRTSRLQVLPAEGLEPTWWRLIGRVLNVFFRRGDESVGLSLTDEHDQVPADVIECWGVCYWCLQASWTAPVSRAGQVAAHRWFWPLAERIYCLTRLTPDELLDGRVGEVMDGMGRRFAERMGVDPEAIAAGHEACVARLESRWSDA